MPGGLISRCSLKRLGAAFLAITLAPSPLRAEGSGVIVISEIMYHPASGERELEFIELFNATSAPIDLSAWFFSQGIQFTFPGGTWIDGRSYLVVCADRDRIQTEYDLPEALGNWGVGCETDDGRGCGLDSGGEVLTLSEHNGIVHCQVRYNDRGKWPAAADGTGHSLEMESPYREQDDPDSWRASGSMGGSPGRPNRAREQPPSPLTINEALLLSSDGKLWVELHNASDVDMDLTGYHLSDDRGDLQKSTLAAGTVAPAGGWVSFSESDLGFDLSPVRDTPEDEARVFLALTNPDASSVLDAYIFEPEVEDRSEARFPDGDEDFSHRATPTRDAANAIDVETDIVINEIMYHRLDGEERGEFIELYHRGAVDIDLGGWSLTSGFNYEFPEGTRITAGSFIVVARDVNYLRDTYGLDESILFGPEPGNEAALRRFGSLRDDGERINLRDANGNLADSVRYHDGGQWPDWADGKGSSLELIDPWQNNGVAASWDASDDAHKAKIIEHSYTGRSVTGAEPELRILLLGSGITLLDDLRMSRREILFDPSLSLVEIGDECRYFKGTTEPSNPRSEWRQPDFDDSAWFIGPTPIGYGSDDKGIETFLEDMEDNYISLFLRKRFTIADVDAVEVLLLDVRFDDGYIAYLNGTRIDIDIRGRMNGNMRDEDTFDASARNAREDAREELDISAYRHLLREGENVLAIQGHNATISSADFVLAPRLYTGRWIQKDGPDIVTNGDFEDDLSVPGRPNAGFWYIEGNHLHSGRTGALPIAGGGSLKVVATGRGDNKVNRLEISLPELVAGADYTISFKTRWVVGAQTMLTQGHRQAFPMSHTLGVPKNTGTPGAPNSTLEDNSGPVIDKLDQEPALPRPGQPTSISVRVSDSDGLRSVILLWSLDSPAEAGSVEQHEILMTGPDARDRFVAQIPGQPTGRSIVFQIIAEDETGAMGRYPRQDAERSHPRLLDPSTPELIDGSYIVYRHDNPRVSTDLSYRFWMHDLNEAHLNERKLHSNDRIEGSFVFENSDIYHGSQLRFSGSPFARQRWNESYRVAMPKDRSLHGAIKKFNMEDHQGAGGRDARERISNYLIRHNQGSVQVPFSYQWVVDWQVNDRVVVPTSREHLQTPGREMIQRWFPGDDDGSLFEMDDRHVFSDGGTRQTSIDGRLTYPPYANQAFDLGLDADDKELYRFYFGLRQNEANDDYSQLIDAARLMSSSALAPEDFDIGVFETLNVEEFLRIWSIRLNTDDWDTWGARRGKNCYIYRPETDGRWVLIPWDMELTYGSTSAFSLPQSIDGPYSSLQFAEVRGLMNRPRIRRMYYGILAEMIDHQFNSEFLTPYMNKLEARQLQGHNVGRANGFIDRRRIRIEEKIRESVYPGVRLEIGTNGGKNFASTSVVTTIEGRAPVDITHLVISSNLRPDDASEVTFSGESALAWTSMNITLAPGVNEITALGFDGSGSLVDFDSIEIAFEGGTPVILSVAPDRVRTGELIEIMGSGFFTGQSIFFDDAKGEEVDFSGLPQLIIARVPPGLPPGPVDLIVGTPGGPLSASFEIELLPAGDLFLRGDVDTSGNIDIADGVQVLLHLFRGKRLSCQDAADTDDNGQIEISDGILILNYLFRHGTAPRPPSDAPGVDPSDTDDLTCEKGGF